MNKKILFIFTATILTSGISFADDYLRDSATGEVVRSGTGLCWRTGYWTPAGAIKECDPEYFKDEAPKPAKKLVKLEADVLFKFNSYELSDKGKTKLNELLNETQNNSIYDVVGHTDRIGSEKYNQKLSLQRAQTVKNYLTKNRTNITVNSKGVGFSEPSGETTNCKGTKVTKQLISCLAPDRRVEITIE